MHLGESTEPLWVALHSPWKYTRFSLIGYTGVYTVSIVLRARVTNVMPIMDFSIPGIGLQFMTLRVIFCCL